jgi:hypothetical protein
MTSRLGWIQVVGELEHVLIETRLDVLDLPED